MSGTFRLGLVQLSVGANKAQNLANAAAKVREAASSGGAKIVSLPECFNSPYGTQHFPEYAESVPDGESCRALGDMARENKGGRGIDDKFELAKSSNIGPRLILGWVTPMNGPEPNMLADFTNVATSVL
jgi:hypothetical protein